jgi:Ca-activated chloride channel family protein
VRFGIITPYTSFLIDENDILTQSGRAAAAEQFARDTQALSAQSSGAAAVGAADMAANMQEAAAPMPMATMTGDEVSAGGQPGGQQAIQTVEGKTFFLRDGVWTDSTFDPDTMSAEQVPFLSDAYFALLNAQPRLGPFFALGDRVIVVLDGVAYEVTAAE